MQPKKIPIFNENFNLFLFLYIIKRSIWISAILIFFCVLCAYIYVRYTPRLYDSKSVIQVNSENKTRELLQIENIFESSDMAPVIELLRSNEFLKRTFNKLPLKVRYFLQGTFLSEELYTGTPYRIETETENTTLYNVPIYIKFFDKNICLIKYELNNKEYEYKLRTDKWSLIKGGRIKIIIDNYASIENQQSGIKKNYHYFVIKNPNSVMNEHRRNLEISLLNQSAQTIKISFKDNNPAKTAEIVNTIAEEFLKYNIEKKKESAQNILIFIDKQLENFLIELDKTEKKLHAFKKDNKFVLDEASITSYFSLINDKMNTIEEEILNIEFELATLQNIENQIINNENLNIYELIALLSGTKSEGILVNILNMIQSLLSEKENLLYDVTANNHRIKVIDKQIHNQKQILSQFVDKTIERLEIKKNDYNTKLNEFENRIFDQSAIDELEYSRLKRIYTINEGFFNQLVEKKAHYMISEAGFVSENVILERASVPKFHISPSKKIVYSIALVVWAIISFCIIFVRYLLHDKITSTSDIKSYTNVPISGTIPEFKEKIPVSKLIVLRKPKSVISEAFRTIRSNLEFISHEEGSKVIVISSTVSSEGKTFVAINLAGIIAVSGKKVILVDLDLRKPKIHISFESENDKGMSTILIKKNSIEECIKNSKLKNLYYLTAGPTPPNPSELANSKEMDALLKTLKEKFDVIIIDTPPIGIVTDAVNIYRKADHPLYILKTGLSKRIYLNSVNDLNDNKGMKKLSIILNSIESASSKYGYGFDYYDDEELHQRKKFFIKRFFSKKRI